MVMLDDSWLTAPTGDEEISRGTLAYIRTRVRSRLYTMIIREFKLSGISQETLASRLDYPPEEIARFLSRPGNWELDMWVEVLFAISGAVPEFAANHVGNKPQ